MKYKEVKKILNDNGFVLKYCQTDGELDSLEFINPNIEGTINVHFDDDCDIPDNILEGEEFNYDTAEFLMDFGIRMVVFYIDKSISFFSENVVDAWGDSNDNIILLAGEDVNMFEDVIKIVINPYANFDFQIIYENKITEFYNKIREFFPLIGKYDFKIQKTSGAEDTLYTQRNVMFKFSSHVDINFWFTPLTWKQTVVFDFGNNSYEEHNINDLSLENFKEILYRKVSVFNESIIDQKYRIEL